PGDLVATLSDGAMTFRPIVWVGHRRIDLKAHPRPAVVAPIRICSGTFVDNVPHCDLLLSPDHAVFVDNRLICARQLINGTTIRQELDLPYIDYYHVELDRHSILLSAGLPTESYLDTGNRSFFANADARITLHPSLVGDDDHPTRKAAS